MKNALDAYRDRLISIQDMVLNRAADFIDRGYFVYLSKGDRVKKGMTLVHPNGNHLHINFSEVPYRWNCGISWKPNAKTGSGRTVKDFFDIDRIPDTDTLIKLMQPYYLPTDTAEKADKCFNYLERLTFPLYELKHNEEVLHTGSENSCYFKLQRTQSQSADWAIKHEGYTISPKES